MAEPRNLVVGLTAWRLAHAPGAPAAHTGVDGCAWAPTTECTFTVAVAHRLLAPDDEFVGVEVHPAESVPRAPAAGAPFAEQFVAEIPVLHPPPLLLRVTATPTARLKVRGKKVGKPDDVEGPAFFPATAFFVYEGDGRWRRHARSAAEDEENSAELFAPPIALNGLTAEPFAFALLAFFCSRVRNRTRRAFEVTRERNTTLLEFVPPSANFQHVDRPPTEGRVVRFARRELSLDSDVRVLEVSLFRTPALVAVSWPNANNEQPDADGPLARAAAMEALVFFHASNAQNAHIYGRTRYPFGLEQIANGFTGYLNPAAFPLRSVYPMGMPYQIRAAGKNVVLVLPLNRVTKPELTNLNDGEQAIELLEEIQASFLRAAGHYFRAPRLGRLAIASFSAAIGELAEFYGAVNASPLLRSLLKEVYVFDVRHGDGAGCAEIANGFKAWAGKDPERRVRLYNDTPSDGHRSLVGVRSLPATPFVIDSADGRFTAGVVTDADWLRSSTGRDHFLFKGRTELASAVTDAVAPAGVTSLVMKEPAKFRVGDVVVLTDIGQVVRVTGVKGKTLTFEPPTVASQGVESSIFRYPPPLRSTTTADATVPGDTALTVASTDRMHRDAVLFIDGRFYCQVDDLTGNVVQMSRRLDVMLPKGTKVDLLDSAIRTLLSEDHPAGSTVLNVFEAAASGFVAGQEVGIGFTEFARIAEVRDTALVLKAPTTQPFPRGAFVGVLVERKHSWGMYHGLFPSMWLTDAVRKSGFRDLPAPPPPPTP